jgi:molybdopterin molybdotransferase
VRLLLASARVVAAGQAPAAGGTYDANAPMLAASVERDGGAVIDLRHIGRARSEVREALRDALDADIVLVAGGTGPGRDDHAAAALAEAGALTLHGVALQPGTTLGAGRIGRVPVFLLPGPPAHCLWAYELVAGRAIRLLAGHRPELPYAMATLRLARKIVSEVGTVEVCPVRRVGAGAGEAEPMPSLQEAGLAAAAHADGFILVPETSEGYPQGAAVAVYLRR